jgi:hypothetical protein
VHIAVEPAEDLAGRDERVIGEEEFDLAVESVDGEGGGDAVPGDIEQDDGEGLVVAVVGGALAGEEVVAADLAHGFVLIGEVDILPGARDREHALVDGAGVGEFLAERAVALLDEGVPVLPERREWRAQAIRQPGRAMSGLSATRMMCSATPPGSISRRLKALNPRTITAGRAAWRADQGKTSEATRWLTANDQTPVPVPSPLARRTMPAIPSAAMSPMLTQTAWLLVSLFLSVRTRAAT